MIDWDCTKEKFGIIDLNSYRPKVVVKCDKCGKLMDYTIRVKSKIVNNNVSWYCQKCVSLRKQVKDKLKESTLKLWENENYKKIITDNSANNWKSEEYKRYHKKSVNSKENKSKCSEAAKKAWKNNEYRNLRIQQSKDKWKEEEYRQKIIKSIRKLWSNKEFKDKFINIMRSDKIKSIISNNSKHMWNNDDFREKMAIIMNSKEYKEIVSINSRRIWESYDYKIKMAKIRNGTPKNDTSIEMSLYSILDDLNIKYNKQYRIGFYLFDCFLPDFNILIECNGDYWHNLDVSVRNDKAKSTYINKYFPNYKLYSIWEHEFKCENRIKDLLLYWTGNNNNQIEFNFNDVIIEKGDAEDCKLFLSKYHYLGNLGNNSVKLLAKIKDVIVAVCIFGPITRKESAERLGYKSSEMLELTRFCISPFYQKKNFASWFISKSIKHIKNINKYKCLISFADTTFNHTGCIYKSSNWVLDGVVNSSYWYVDSDGYVMHKKTLYGHAISLKMKESEFAEKYGYKKVIGKEKYRYIYRLK